MKGKQLKEYGCTYLLMEQLGVIEEIVDGIYVLLDRTQYDEVIGLGLDNHCLEEI